MRGLIIVDLQKAFKPPADMVQKICAIRDDYDIVITTQFFNQFRSSFETQLNYKNCQLGSPESAIVAPLRPNHVFDRFSYGVQQDHIDVLKKYNTVACWDIVGCDTEACVLATCYNLWDAGIRFRVIKELCHSSGGPELREAAFRIMQRSFGQE